MRSFALLTALYSAGVIALPFVEVETVVATVVQYVTVGHHAQPTPVVQAAANPTSCSETPVAAAATPNVVYVQPSQQPQPQPFVKPVVHVDQPVVHVDQPVVHPIVQQPTVQAAQPTVQAVDVPVQSDSHLNVYQNTVIKHHNIHRANHSAPALVWDSQLAAIAQSIAQSCVYAHNVKEGGGGYGQNIAAGVSADNVGSVITSLFYNNECGLYDGQYGKANPNMQLFEKFGHFTQIVWKNTQSVGCATVDCSGRGLANTGGGISPYFTVCNYKGPGNYAGQYGTNVSPPLGHAPAGAQLS